MKKSKNKKTKNTEKKWEKVFFIASISVISMIIGIYAYRTFYYYKKFNITPEDAKLVDIVTNGKNIVFSGSGLYKEDEEHFYYYGKDVDNYFYYDGILWQIVSIDPKGIKVIADKSITSLVFGMETTYEESDIYKWLNKDTFLNNISERNLIETTWCNEPVDINNYKCDKSVSSYAGLLSTDEYLKAGGINSYLNNGSYFWTLNTDAENRAYYVHSQGGINNEVSSNSSYYSYGVRPIIYIDRDVTYLSGSGTEKDPYMIEKNDDIIVNNQAVGTYIKYHDYVWRILKVNEDNTLLILDGYIEEEEKPVELQYNQVMTYLNDKFLTKFNKEELVKYKFNKTIYNSDNKYDYSGIKNTTESYVGLPVVGDMFISDYPGSWLNTYSSEKQKLTYTAAKESSLFADLETSKNYLRPVISIKNGLVISSGDGTINNPYIVGDSE